MPACSCEHDLKFNGVSRRYRTILWIVIGINAFMFLFETFASFAADSMALRAELERMISECTANRVAECRVIEVLSNHELCLHDAHE